MIYYSVHIGRKILFQNDFFYLDSLPFIRTQLLITRSDVHFTRGYKDFFCSDLNMKKLKHAISWDSSMNYLLLTWFNYQDLVNDTQNKSAKRSWTVFTCRGPRYKWKLSPYDDDVASVGRKTSDEGAAHEPREGYEELLMWKLKSNRLMFPRRSQWRKPKVFNQKDNKLEQLCFMNTLLVERELKRREKAFLLLEP